MQSCNVRALDAEMVCVQLHSKDVCRISSFCSTYILCKTVGTGEVLELHPFCALVLSRIPLISQVIAFTQLGDEATAGLSALIAYLQRSS